jgi:hypothetical protein
MRLFLIEGHGCKHITDIMPAIKAVYQMEQEFFPYLTVDFVPYREYENTGIVLVTKLTTIRKDYTFMDKQDINDLRNLIWFHLKKEVNIKDITHDGCLSDFREVNKNNVIQGWQEKKRLSKNDSCCKSILKSKTPEPIKTNILHDAYKLKKIDSQNRNICKKVRFNECRDNYPHNSDSFKRCIDEVEWLCNNGYPNKTVNAMNELVKNTRLNLYKYLNDNNLKVNKQKFDEMIDAGLFDDLGNRMGNKVISDKNVSMIPFTAQNEKNYYLNLIEGYGTTNISIWYIIVLILLIIVIYLKN